MENKKRWSFDVINQGSDFRTHAAPPRLIWICSLPPTTFRVFRGCFFISCPQSNNLLPRKALNTRNKANT
jgi:hypothetical protein